MKKQPVFIAIIISVLFLPFSAISAEYIKIAGFNIAEFGEGGHPATRRLDYIADLLIDNGLHLIAIQEVGVKAQADSQVVCLVRIMNQKVGTGSKYYSYITPQSGDERYAFIYKSPVILQDEYRWFDSLKYGNKPSSGGKTYFRVPFGLSFKANDFDFYVVVMHLTWGNLDRRKKEVKKLRDFLLTENQGEDDWIVIGDMNRYGKHRKSDTDKAFDQLLTGTWKYRYRFPLLEAITEPDDIKVYTAAKDEFSTTVAKSRNLYDQISITKGVFNEFDTSDPIFGEDVGIIAFDMDVHYSAINDHNRVKFEVSDHRPIWIRIRIDKADDD